MAETHRCSVQRPAPKRVALQVMGFAKSSTHPQSRPPDRATLVNSLLLTSDRRACRAVPDRAPGWPETTATLPCFRPVFLGKQRSGLHPCGETEKQDLIAAAPSNVKFAFASEHCFFADGTRLALLDAILQISLFGKLKLTNCARAGNRTGLFHARLSRF
jgi:hypothetical protein